MLRKVICSEPSSTRREKAKLAGAHHLFSPLETDIVAEVRKLTGSDSGVDLAFEAAANERALVTAIKAVKTRGTVLNVSVWSREPRIPMNELVFSEKAILGASCCEFSTWRSSSLKGDTGHKGLEEVADDPVCESGRRPRRSPGSPGRAFERFDQAGA